MTTKVYNIKTDFGAANATANGQKVLNAHLTITPGSTLLTASTALFSSTVNAEVGKIVGFSTLDSGTPFFGSTITASTSTTITLANPFVGTAMSSSLQSIEWGTWDEPAFHAFHDAALAWQAAHPTDIIQLNIPGPGRYIFTLLQPLSDGAFIGIKNLNVIFSGGAIVSSCNGALVAAITLGTIGMQQDNLHSCRIATVGKGATSVFAIANANLPAATTIAAAVSLFTVGGWACVCGIDLEGAGWPPNQGFIDYVQVLSKNSTTGEITFTPPLQHYYKSTWPTYNDGSTPGSGGVDQGGPATLRAMMTEWDVTHTYTDIIMDNPTWYSGCGGRSMTLINPTYINPSLSSPFMGSTGCGALASGSLNWTQIGGDMGIYSMEVDKMVQQFTMQDVNSPNASLNLFSGSSMENLTITNCHLNQIIGTPRNLIITDSVISKFGCGTSYGRNEKVTITNSEISDFGPDIGHPSSIYGPGGMRFIGIYGEGINNIPGASMTAGVIAIPTAYIQPVDGGPAWICEGNWVQWCRTTDGTVASPYFQMTNVTQDSTHTYIHTTWPGGFPTGMAGTGVLGLHQHPCPDFTAINSSCSTPLNVDDGSVMYGLSQAPNHIPLTSYTKCKFTSAGGFVYRNLTGFIKKINITVDTALVDPSFANTITFRPSLTFLDTNNAATTYSYLVNLEVTGTRSLIVSGSTYPASWTGVQSGDTLPALTAAKWWGGAYVLTVADIHVGGPWGVTVELQTEQGVDLGLGRTFTCTFV